MKLFRGLCVGGPLDGKEVTKIVEHFQEIIQVDPTLPAPEPPFAPIPIGARRALYDWSADQSNFVFQGYEL